MTFDPLLPLYYISIFLHDFKFHLHNSKSCSDLAYLSSLFCKPLSDILPHIVFPMRPLSPFCVHHFDSPLHFSTILFFFISYSRTFTYIPFPPFFFPFFATPSSFISVGNCASNRIFGFCRKKRRKTEIFGFSSSLFLLNCANVLIRRC